MAIVNVSEYSGLSPLGQIPAGPALAAYDIAVGGASVAGPTLNTATRVVRLNTDVTCRVILGTSPTALATSSRFAAAQTEYWGVPVPGMAIAVITST